MKIIRVFPRRTSYTPTDDIAFVGRPGLIRPEADEVHVSCTFTWDKPVAEQLARDWAQYYPVVKVGGPAYDDRGGEFTPGLYLKHGEVITSRGCPNNCSYCFVPKREGKLRLLSIQQGWDILDNNLLACPRQHIEAVLDMLVQQKGKASFRGGLDAHLLKPWFVNRIAEIGLKQAFFAYDRPNDRAACDHAFRLMRGAGFGRQKINCYVLVGYNGEDIKTARERLEWVKSQGATPFAMYYRDDKSPEHNPKDWTQFLKVWSRPGAIFSQHQRSIENRQYVDENEEQGVLW